MKYRLANAQTNKVKDRPTVRDINNAIDSLDAHWD